MKQDLTEHMATTGLSPANPRNKPGTAMSKDPSLKKSPSSSLVGNDKSEARISNVNDNQRPLTSTSMSPVKSKSKALASSVIIPEESAPTDVTDPVYRDKDPISASLNLRKGEGSVTSILHNEKRQPYFYTLELEGPGLDLD